MTGQIVYSKAGRDKGSFLVAVGKAGDGILVCDGKKRPLERPKRKNPKHLSVTKTVLTEQQISTNKTIRRALAIYRDEAPLKEEK
ncbi:MAG: KOW domain-containing RNA-binding protein [Clostridia bacterium]|nr:KOW domain-containing RNA-binding protein [Clostridia bacterium]